MTTVPPALSEGCPICGSTNWRSPNQRLYGVRICRRCCYRLANRRQLAFGLDIVLLWVLLNGLGNLAPMLINFDLLALLGIVLFTLKDGVRGRSPGKLICGLQVVHEATQRPIGPGTSFQRNLPIIMPQLAIIALSFADAYLILRPGPDWWFIVGIVALVGNVLLLLYMGYQLNASYRWGDRWAGTKTVWKKFAHRLPFDQRGICCSNCGYDLTGNVSGTCPECGTPTLPRKQPNKSEPQTIPAVQPPARSDRQHPHA